MSVSASDIYAKLMAEFRDLDQYAVLNSSVEEYLKSIEPYFENVDTDTNAENDVYARDRILGLLTQKITLTKSIITSNNLKKKYEVVLLELKNSTNTHGRGEAQKFEGKLNDENNKLERNKQKLKVCEGELEEFKNAAIFEWETKKWETKKFIAENFKFLEDPYFSEMVDDIKKNIAYEYVLMKRGDWKDLEDGAFLANTHGRTLKALKKQYLIEKEANNFFEMEFLIPAKKLGIDTDEYIDENLRKNVIEKYIEMKNLGFESPDKTRSFSAWIFNYPANAPGGELLKIKQEFFATQAKLELDSLIQSSFDNYFQEIRGKFGGKWTDFEEENPELVELIKNRVKLVLEMQVSKKYGEYINKYSVSASRKITMEDVYSEAGLAIFLYQETKRLKEVYVKDNSGEEIPIPFENLSAKEKLNRISMLAKKAENKSEFEVSVKEVLFKKSVVDENKENQELNAFYKEFEPRNKDDENWLINQVSSLTTSAKNTAKSTFKFVKSMSVESTLFFIVKTILDFIKSPLMILMQKIKGVINDECSIIEKVIKIFFCSSIIAAVVVGIVYLSPKIIAVSLLLQAVQTPVGILLAYLCVSAVSGSGSLTIAGIDAVFRAYERAVYGYRDHFKYQVKDALKSTFGSDLEFLKELNEVVKLIGKELDDCGKDIERTMLKIEQDSDNSIDTTALEKRLEILVREKESLKFAWDRIRFRPAGANDTQWKNDIEDVIGKVNKYLDILHKQKYLDLCLTTQSAGISYHKFTKFRDENLIPEVPSYFSANDIGPPAYEEEPSAPESDVKKTSALEFDEIDLDHKKSHGHLLKLHGKKHEKKHSFDQDKDHNNKKKQKPKKSK